MIGFIALAGIIVRNSILLVEFARGKVDEGWDVRDAVLTAGRVRLRPILITAMALVIGSMVPAQRPDLPGHGGVAAVRLADRHLPDADRHSARLRLGAQIFQAADRDGADGGRRRRQAGVRRPSAPPPSARDDLAASAAPAAQE